MQKSVSLREAAICPSGRLLLATSPAFIQATLSGHQALGRGTELPVRVGLAVCREADRVKHTSREREGANAPSGLIVTAQEPLGLCC